MPTSERRLADAAAQQLLVTLKKRFAQNMHLHQGADWTEVESRLKAKAAVLWSVHQMEITGGEPDVVMVDGQHWYFDCSTESPKERRSLCYDRAALNERKEAKPRSSALDMAAEMGIEVLDETQYRALQTLEHFDLKTSSWIKTPDSIRRLGGALFCDYRYGTVFVHHNGASSYYAARGFRGAIKL
jgi:Protein of unknown function (DUF4256)